MCADGASALRDEELLAIVLRCGTPGRPVEQLARETLAYVNGLPGLSAAPLVELQNYCGLGAVQAVTVSAMMELARRWACRWDAPAPPIDSSAALYHYIAPALKDRPEEHCIVVALDSRNRILRTHWLSRGDHHAAVVTPRGVLAVGLACQAAALAIIHNHPSGDPTPSADDIALTAQLQRAGDALQLPLLDHVIVGAATYFSFRDAGYLRDEF